MLKKEVNISSFQKNISKVMDIVLSGDEIIITKGNVPIAKVTPIKETNIVLKSNFFAPSAIKNKRVPVSEAPENWFG